MAGSWHPIGGGATSSDGWHPIGDAGPLQWAIIMDSKTAGTNGGTFTTGAWRTRDLNTEKYDPNTLVAISSNQFTLIPGKYIAVAFAPAFQVDFHVARIYNATAAAEVQLGTAAFSLATNQIVTHSVVVTDITANGSDAFELQHQSSATKATNGFGVAVNGGMSIAVSAEVYSVILLIKIA